MNSSILSVMWTLICAFLVIFMQAGFAMMETGFTRAKNAGHTMAMTLIVFVIAVLGYWSIGYGLQTGSSGFFLSGAASDASIIMLFLSQVVYLNIAATIPTGAMAERWTFSPLWCTGSSWPCSYTPCTHAGCGAEDGWLNSAPASVWAMGLSISQAHQSCIWSAA